MSCRREEFMHWVEMLPDTQTPSWLGLPSNAEKVLLTTQGTPQPVIFVICALMFCHSNWTTTHPDSSSVHQFRFHVFTGQIINHLSFYSSVFTFILTGCLSATSICFGQNTVCVVAINTILISHLVIVSLHLVF